MSLDELNVSVFENALVLLQMEPMASLRAQEPFILMIDTKCTSAIPITIVRTNFKPVSVADIVRNVEYHRIFFVESICAQRMRHRIASQ